MHRPAPGGDGGLAYGGSYGGGSYGGDELALALHGLALGGEHLPGSPYDAYAHALPSMSPRAAGQDAYNDASAHADLLFDAQDVSWLRAAYGQGFDPERLMAGEIMQAEHTRQPMSPGYHSLYKTELCRSYEETSTCRYGSKCQFAHGQDELRPVMRHPRYKTELCRTFATSGTCPYGTRCRFIHYRGAAPVASAPPGAFGAKLTVTVPPGSPRSPRVAPFLPAQPAMPAEAAGGAGPGSPPPSPQSPAALRPSPVPEGAPRAAAATAIHAGAAMPETAPSTPPRSSGGDDDGCNNGSGSDDSGGRARGRSRLPIFKTLCTTAGAGAGAGGKELSAAAPPSSAPAPAVGGAAAVPPPKSPKKKNGPTPKPPAPAPNRATMQLRRGAVCE